MDQIGENRGYVTKIYTQSLFLREKIPFGKMRFKCKHCSKQFVQKDLITHLQVHTGEKPHKCKLCNKTFISSKYLKKHKKIHTDSKKFECVYCNKKFLQKNYLTNHIRVHTGEKPYKCEFCDKSFVRSDDYKRHEKIHTDDKKFECDSQEKNNYKIKELSIPLIKCDDLVFKQDLIKVYHSLQNKIIQIQQSSNQEQIKNQANYDFFKCDYCDETFYAKELIIAHINKCHLNVSCVYCDKAFYDAKELEFHMKIHNSNSESFSNNSFKKSVNNFNLESEKVHEKMNDGHKNDRFEDSTSSDMRNELEMNFDPLRSAVTENNDVNKNIEVVDVESENIEFKNIKREKSPEIFMVKEIVKRNLEGNKVENNKFEDKIISTIQNVFQDEIRNEVIKVVKNLILGLKKI